MYFSNEMKYDNLLLNFILYVVQNNWEPTNIIEWSLYEGIQLTPHIWPIIILSIFVFNLDKNPEKPINNDVIINIFKLFLLKLLSRLLFLIKNLEVINIAEQLVKDKINK